MGSIWKFWKGAALLTMTLLVLTHAPSAWARMPVVVFQVETEAGQDAARRCHEIWMAEGPRLTAEILPRDSRADTVTCLIVNTSSFQRHFAGRLPDWGVGVALPSGRVIALDYSRLPAVGRGLREVFLHEMVHALLFQGSGGAWLPTWLHEGTAMLYSGEWRFSDTVSLILDGRVPDLSRLQGRFPIPHDRADRAYRTSLLAVSRLREGFGEEIIVDLVRETKNCENFSEAFTIVTGEDLDDFHRDFAAAMKLKFGWMLFLTRWPGLFVLTAFIFAVGAIRKIIITRRRLAAMEDVPDAPQWPERPDSPD
ncbi:MAG: hypothetical protein KAH56_06480 [Candidatus Krumholzibacteria bacterium]|nr:hypothetical protein [Candidatus Krumholzibacteria bacterium]